MQKIYIIFFLITFFELILFSAIIFFCMKAIKYTKAQLEIVEEIKNTLPKELQEIRFNLCNLNKTLVNKIGTGYLNSFEIGRLIGDIFVEIFNFNFPVFNLSKKVLGKKLLFYKIFEKIWNRKKVLFN